MEEEEEEEEQEEEEEEDEEEEEKEEDEEEKWMSCCDDIPPPLLPPSLPLSPHLAVPNSLGVIELSQECLAEFLRPVVLKETHHRLRQQLTQDTPLHDI